MANAIPAGAAHDGDVPAVRAGASANSISRPARGFTRQVAVRSVNIRSRQAWLQAMQVLISSVRPSLTFRAKSGLPAADGPWK